MLKKKRTVRGQIFSGEFMVAYLIFLVVLVLVLYLWNTTTKEIMETNTYYSINEAAIDAAEQMVRTPGNPGNWTAGNVSSIGLANDSRRLMGYKVRELAYLMSDTNTSLCTDGDSNYECYRHMLGVGNYDFYINITYINDTTVVLNSTQCYAGRWPENETRKVTVVRTALLDEDIVLVHLTVWKT